LPAVALLGGVSLTVDGRTLAGPATQRHRLALLALLVLARPRPVSRDRLAAYLWPERDEANARNLLKQAVHALRRALGDATVQSNADELLFEASAVACDVVEFETLLEDGHHERAISSYAGPLLDGFHLQGAAEFEHRISDERDRLRRRYVQALETLAERATVGRDWSTAAEWWRRVAIEEPYNGLVTVRYMAALDASGDRAAAIRQARRHAQLLRDDFDAEPDEQVVALADRLRRASVRTTETVVREGPHRPPDVGASTRPPTAERALPGPPPSYPLVGRVAERDALYATWDATRDGRPRLALITGEAGIGKTRLAEELLEAASGAGTDVARSRSYAAEGQLAYGPLTDWLRSPVLHPALVRLDVQWLTEVARLLPELREVRRDLPDAEPMTESWQRQRFFTGIVRAVLGDRAALLLLVDDLQWCDRDTLEWLHYFLRSDGDARVLVVGTARTDEVGADHPLMALVHDLRRRGQLVEVELSSLSAEETASLAAHVAGRDLGAHGASVHRDTEGNPLFVVESVRARLSRAGTLVAGPTASPDSAPETSPGRDPMPAQVHAVIRSRLATLSPAAQRLANVAATIGRDFELAVLRRACDPDDAAMLESLDELWQRRIIREHSAGSFDFSHDRLREVAYESLGPVRRTVLHRRVAEALRAHHATDLDRVSGRIATHYERSGSPEEALGFYERAADVATHIFANEEAIGYLGRAIALLDALPRDSQRDRRELSLRIALLTPLRATRGWASRELGETAARARLLADRVGTQSERLRAACEMVSFQLVRGNELRAALETAEEALELARAEGDPRLLTPAHHLLGITLCQRGSFTRARTHLEEAASAYVEAHHHDHVRLLGADFGVFSHAVAAHALWHLGYADRARRSSRLALELAERLAHPFSRAIAIAYDAMLHQFLGEVEEVSTRAAALVDVSGRHGFAYYHAWGTILGGWALARRQDVERGMAQIREGMSALRATGAELRWSYYLSLLAEPSRAAASRGSGLALLDEALRTAEASGERWRSAELHRLRGELLLESGEDERAAELSLRRARDVARQQEAKMLELRAASSLSRLLRRRGGAREAAQMLGETYAWFTEGFDTAELTCAAALMAKS
jgi:predicted ATPase/DNA-binding SARP family transcriptional activator